MSAEDVLIEPAAWVSGCRVVGEWAALQRDLLLESPERFGDALDEAERSLRADAVLAGANAIVNYEIHVQADSWPARLHLQGTAVRLERLF